MNISSEQILHLVELAYATGEIQYSQLEVVSKYESLSSFA